MYKSCDTLQNVVVILSKGALAIPMAEISETSSNLSVELEFLGGNAEKAM